jgi:hypothetical protein
MPAFNSNKTRVSAAATALIRGALQVQKAANRENRGHRIHSREQTQREGCVCVCVCV